MALERPSNNRTAQAGKRDRAPERMRSLRGGTRIFAETTGLRDAQAGKRDRAPELMRGSLRGA